MTEIAARFEKVSAAFTARVEDVPGDAWERPAPCDGWVARDVVRHLVEWLPGAGFLLGTFGVETGPIPSVDTDPAAAWKAVRDAIQRALDDPSVATRVDERLDPDEVHRQLDGFESMPPEVDDAMRASGHFGPRVTVSDDADEQTRLLAFLRRRS